MLLQCLLKKTVRDKSVREGFCQPRFHPSFNNLIRTCTKMDWPSLITFSRALLIHPGSSFESGSLTCRVSGLHVSQVSWLRHKSKFMTLFLKNILLTFNHSKRKYLYFLSKILIKINMTAVCLESRTHQMCCAKGYQR